MNVVKTIQRSNGVGGFTNKYFYYEGGWYNEDNQKFLGFKKISQIQQDSGIVTDTYFNIEMPLHGTVARVETKTTDGDWISRVTNNYVTHPENPKYVYSDYGITEVFKLQDLPLSVSKTINVFDRYGGLERSETIIGSGLSDTEVTDVLRRVTTVNEINHDLDNWLLGFTGRTTVTTEHGDGSDRRTASHEYIREAGTLDVKQSIQYVGTNIESTTTYIRDQRGGANASVVTQTIVQARDDIESPSAERSAWLDNFENGFFPTESFNALGHKTTYEYDHRFGKVKSVLDPNDLFGTTTYDALGRDTQQTSAAGVVTKLESYFCAQSPYTCPNNAVYVSFSRSTHPSEGDKLAAPLVVNFYDSLQRVIRSQTQLLSGNWVKQDTFFDDLGRLDRVSEPYTGSWPALFTEYSEYNALGEAQGVTHPDGSETSFMRVKDGSLDNTIITTTVVGSLSGINQLRKETFTDALGQVFEATGDKPPVHFTYNSQGQLETTKVNHNSDTVVTIEYDVAGNKLWIDDPAAGRIDYEYNGFGELRRQIWQKGTSNEKSIRFDYDKLGREDYREEFVGSTRESYTAKYYDNAWVGALYFELKIGNKAFASEYVYGDLGRLLRHSNYSSGWFHMNHTYDAFGRPETTTYPTGLKVEQLYTDSGIHYKTLDVTGGQQKMLWQLSSDHNSRGQYLYSKLGNNVVTKNSYDARTGQLTGITSGRVNSGFSSVKGTLQKYSYQWDSIGNLQQRASKRVNSSGSTIENITENFEYDKLNRLQFAETFGIGVASRTLDYDYDRLGNLINNGRGTLHYDQVNGASVYGITNGNGRDYHYDAYGNVIRRGSDTNEYDVFNKPTKLGNTEFWYGTNREKIEQKTGNRRTRFLFGGTYEREDSNGTLTETVRAGSYVQIKTAGTTKNEYHLKDHIGSTDVVTDQNGNQVSRMAFDAFGNRLESHFASGALATASSASYHGYTGHGQLDELGLIHMGGRVYDPGVGRFLSADLFVQAPHNSQSYNRYSYVLNNPLSLVDPTGYQSTDSTEDENEKSAREAAERDRAERAVAEAQKRAERYARRARNLGIRGGHWAALADAIYSSIDTFTTEFNAEIQSGQAYGVGGTISGSAQKGLSGGGGSGDSGGGFWSGVGSVVGKIWNLPNSIIGFVFGGSGYVLGNAAYGIHSLFGSPTWSRPTWSSGNNALQFENNPLSFMGALTTGNVINYGGGLTPDNVGAHEASHTYQGQILGPLYLPVNIAGQLASLLTYPISSWRGISPVHGKANFMETGPQSTPERLWPWKF